MSYTLSPSKRSSKKWMVTTPEGKVVHFGAAGYEDYTTHGDSRRRDLYLSRASRQPGVDWSESGVDTPGWWARWLLWSKPSLKSAIREIKNRFNLKVYHTFSTSTIS